MTISTSHPAFHHRDSLEAVLLRTSPSCGDPRLFWENTGEQAFTFTFHLADSEPFLGRAQLLAAQEQRPPVFRKVAGTAAGREAEAEPGDGGESPPEDRPLPGSHTLLEVEGALLSALHPAAATGSVLRIYESTGEQSRVRIKGPLADAGARRVNLLEERYAGDPPLEGKQGD